MSELIPPGQSVEDGYGTVTFSDLPILTHTRLLGVDIAVHQEDMWREVHGDGGNSAAVRNGLVEITRPGVDRRLSVKDRRYLAAWARRNLFNGAGPK